jgi:hypothetical protein
MTTTIVWQSGRVHRVILSDDPLPAAECARLERAGYTVLEVTRQTVRARSAEDVSNAIAPLLQRELFA